MKKQDSCGSGSERYLKQLPVASQKIWGKVNWQGGGMVRLKRGDRFMWRLVVAAKI